MDPLTILLLLGGGALLGSLFSGGGSAAPEVSGEYPEGEVLGEYPGGLFTFESLTPDQKKIMQALMRDMLPKLGLPGQAFGQHPAGTTAGAGLGASGKAGGQGMAQSMVPMLSSLLMGGSSSRGGGR
jgi:hypothetical protein